MPTRRQLLRLCALSLCAFAVACHRKSESLPAAPAAAPVSVAARAAASARAAPDAGGAAVAPAIARDARPGADASTDAADAGSDAGVAQTADAGEDGVAGSARASFSVIEPVGAKCQWTRIEMPGAARRVLASVNDACTDGTGSAVLRADQQRAVLRTTAHLWLVDLASAGPEGGHVERLPDPSPGALTDVGFDAKGTLIALTMQEDGDEGTGVLHYAGHDYTPPPGDGVPALAHAFVFNESGPSRGWAHREVKLTDDAWDLAQGVRALKMAAAIGADEPPRGNAPESEEVDDATTAALARLFDGTGAKKSDDGAWAQLTAVGPSYVYTIAAEGMSYCTGLVALTQGDKLVAAPGLSGSGNSNESVVTDGRYIVVGKSPASVFDADSGTLAFKTAEGGAATFWPALPKGPGSKRELAPDAGPSADAGPASSAATPTPTPK